MLLLLLLLLLFGGSVNAAAPRCLLRDLLLSAGINFTIAPLPEEK